MDQEETPPVFALWSAGADSEALRDKPANGSRPHVCTTNRNGPANQSFPSRCSAETIGHHHVCRTFISPQQWDDTPQSAETHIYDFSLLPVTFWCLRSQGCLTGPPLTAMRKKEINKVTKTTARADCYYPTQVFSSSIFASSKQEKVGERQLPGGRTVIIQSQDGGK